MLNTFLPGLVLVGGIRFFQSTRQKLANWTTAGAKESVLDRHWKEMFDRMGDSAPKPALYGNDYKKVTLQMMLDHNINEFTQDFEELSTAAAKQHGLKKAMGNMKAGW